MKITILAAGLLSTCLTGTAFAQQTLAFASTNAEQHPLVQNVLVDWANKVNEAAGGEVVIELRHGPMIANHTNYYDRVVDDVVQIAWGMSVFYPQKFSQSLVTTLPFIVENAEQGSQAYCKLYESGLLDKDFEGLKPLLFIEFPQSAAHLNGSAVTSLRDLAGKKVMTSDPGAAALLGSVDSIPLSIELPAQYEALQRGTADGTIINFTAFPGFRLHEHLTDHYIAPLGGAGGSVFMTQATWDSLSPEAQAAIESVSGCDASRAYGEWVDKWEASGIALVEGAEGHTVTRASEEDIAVLRERAGPAAEAAYIARVPGGEEIVAKFKEELAAAK